MSCQVELCLCLARLSCVYVMAVTVVSTVYFMLAILSLSACGKKLEDSTVQPVTSETRFHLLPM